tara:strand:- start:2274 stop:2375 length:102 start_codon:yes stop_codon:yes gene_type:complete
VSIREIPGVLGKIYGAASNAPAAPGKEWILDQF